MSTKEPAARLTELLTDQATQGLAPEELEELKSLLAEHPEWSEPQFELAAAAANLADLGGREELPPHLRAKIEADAARHFAERRREMTEHKAPGEVIQFPARRSSRAGWYVAAAACLALALAFLWPLFRGDAGDGRSRESAAAARRARLVASGGAVSVPWIGTEYAAGRRIDGDVVWDSARQEGYMRFRGLPRNDPRESVYQLWIFDAERDERYPVDGGIFNASADAEAEVVVPINAKLAVRRPTLFALTVEEPGGVVVSKRDRLLLTAKVQ